MNDTLLNVVKQIISEYGESILGEAPRLKALFADLARDVPKPQKTVFLSCVEHSYMAILQNAENREECKAELARRMHDEEGFDGGLCAEALETLEKGLFPPLPPPVKTCAKCGKELQPEWKACPFCGAVADVEQAALARNVYEEEGLDIALCNDALDVIETVLYKKENSQNTGKTAMQDVKPRLKINKTILRTAVCVGCLGIVLSLLVLKSMLPDIIMNMAVNKTLESRKNELPLPLPVLEENWTRFELPDIGSIDIPPSLELKSGLQKELSDSITGSFSNPIVFQQKGLNESKQESYDTFVRVIIETTKGNAREFESLYYLIPEYTYDDIKELDTQFKTAAAAGYEKIGIKILQWNTTTLENINGMSCIHYSFTRQLNNRPVVLVNYYIFQNVDSMYSLSFSYQIKDDSLWRGNFEKILSSFRINKINK